MNLHSVFLRDDCKLPTSLDPLRRAIGEHWTCVEDIPSPVFDTMIRHAGWHYIWMVGSCSRRGCAHTREAAIERALIRALKAVAGQPNAAELNSVQVTKYPGFHVANVTLHRRRIQEQTALEANYGKLQQEVLGKQHI